MKAQLYGLIAVLTLLACVSSGTQAEPSEGQELSALESVEQWAYSDPDLSWQSPEIGETLSWQGCQVSFHSEPPVVRVSRDGRALHASPGTARFYRVAVQDLVGTPEPELVILNDYGGTYPALDILVLDGESLDVLYEGRQRPGLRLGDFTGDGTLEFGMVDLNSGPHKGYPTLLYRLGREGLELAPELMEHRRVPSREQLAQAALASSWPQPIWLDNKSVEVVQNLICSGRADLGRFYFERGFKSVEGGKLSREEYWQAIIDNLKQSPDWDIIAEMNQDTLGSDSLRF